MHVRPDLPADVLRLLACCAIELGPETALLMRTIGRVGRFMPKVVLDVEAKPRLEVCAPLTRYFNAVLPDMICASNDLLQTCSGDLHKLSCRQLRPSITEGTESISTHAYNIGKASMEVWITTSARPDHDCAAASWL